MATGIDLVAAAIGGALGGGVLAVAGQELVRWWRRPVLSIDFSNTSQCVLRTRIRLEKGSSETIARDAIFLRLRVINRGRSTARDCRVYMTRILRKSFDGTTQSYEDQDVIPLSWSVRDEQHETLVVPPRINQFVDMVCTRLSDQPCFLRPRARTPKRLNETWREPGVFEIDVAVCAEEAALVRRTLVFEWRGQWDSLKVLGMRAVQ